jgi:hypothetical protein
MEQSLNVEAHHILVKSYLHQQIFSVKMAGRDGIFLVSLSITTQIQPENSVQSLSSKCASVFLKNVELIHGVQKAYTVMVG